LGLRIAAASVSRCQVLGSCGTFLLQVLIIQHRLKSVQIVKNVIYLKFVSENIFEVETVKANFITNINELDQNHLEW
jgi:hypothetical protein